VINPAFSLLPGMERCIIPVYLKMNHGALQKLIERDITWTDFGELVDLTVMWRKLWENFERAVGYSRDIIYYILIF
jgi:hypothetical protein